MSTLDVNVRISKDTHVLVNDVKFSILPSKITAMVGKSGSGKSLTAMSIFGFLPTNFSSNLKINLPINQISIIMQNPKTAFNPLMSIYAHAKESLQEDEQNSDDIIKSAFNDVCLDLSAIKKYPFELSGGMLQRAMIALALLKKPKFIIADEPTTDLDLITQSKILDLLLELKEKSKIGMLLITHDFGVVKKMADDVLVMSEGKIVERGGLDEIFNSPVHDETKLLLNSYKLFRQ